LRVAYRGEDAGDILEAPTAEGPLRAELGPRTMMIAVAQRSLHVSEKFATVTEHHRTTRKKGRRTSFKIEGRLAIARDVPHEDLGVWLEQPGGMRRIFGVEPVSLLEANGLAALASLDRVAQRLRGSIAELAGDIRKAFEIGRGLDKVLLADHGDRYVLYARRLFRDRARLALEIHEDGRVVVREGKQSKEIVVRSRFGVTVWGDYVRFADPHGEDLARIAIPWISPEDRGELARRIGQLVDR
jgi:hypothetical protein